MRVRDIILSVIILGLVVNILSELIWHYLPETNPYTYPIVTIVLVTICILLIIFNRDNDSGKEQRTDSGINIGDISHANGDVNVDNVQRDKIVINLGDKTNGSNKLQEPTRKAIVKFSLKVPPNPLEKSPPFAG